MFKKILILILAATGELLSAQPIAQTIKKHALDVVTSSKDVQKIITGYLSDPETIRAVSNETLFSAGNGLWDDRLTNLPTNETITSYACSPNGQYIAIGYHVKKRHADFQGCVDIVSADKYLDIFNAQNNKLFRSISIKFQDKIKHFLNWDELIDIEVQLSPDSKSVAAITAGNKIRIWDIATGAEKIFDVDAQKFCFAGPNALFCISKTQNRLLLLNTRHNHIMYEHAFTQNYERIEYTRSTPTHLPSKKMIVAHLSGFQRHKRFSRLYIFNTEEQKLVKIIENVGEVREIIYSPDENYIVTVGEKNLYFYNGKTFEYIKCIKKPAPYTYGFNFSKNGKFLVFINHCDNDSDACNRAHYRLNVMDIEKNRITCLNVNTPCCRYVHYGDRLMYPAFMNHEKIIYISQNSYLTDLKIATLEMPTELEA